MLTNLPLKLLLIVVVMFVSCEAVGQSEVTRATRAAKLQALSTMLENRDANDRRQAQDYAQRMGIPARRELPNGQVLELQRIVPGIGPIFYITNNVDAADTVSTDEVWPGGSAALNLDGSGMTVGEWDGGAIFADHPDFTGRLNQVDGVLTVSGHSTHVAGTLIGAGEWLDPRSRGMAYAAQLEAYDWNSDTAEMASAAAGGLLISNHSYGIAAGWLYLGGPVPDNWWWIGGADPSDVEDPNFGYYDSESALWDQIAFDAPYYLIVKASGNDRTDIGPSPGELYTVVDQDGNFLFTSTLPRNADCAPEGYDCLPTHSVAKNILVVGAVDDVPGGYSPFSGPSSVQMASFSSWGPTDDGRIKPDLVGNGMFLISAWPDSPYYAAAAGTSMAAPNVTGSLLLLQEHYENTNGSGNFMRAATLKALAIHTADEAGAADGPDYAFGWGLLNTKKAARLISDLGGAHQMIEGSLLNAAVNTVEFIATESDPVVTATLVWNDPPGTPVAPVLDPSDLMLVNDLDLRITRGPTVYMPWILNPSTPAIAAATGDNFRDNVEQVVASGAGAGSYFVEVSHKGTLLNSESQEYSLIISEAPRPSNNSGFFIDEDFSGGLPADWSVVTSSGVSWTINVPIPGDSHLDNLTGGAGNFAVVDSHFSNNTRTSLRTPTFDLSSSTAVVLRFNSYFYFDFLESINIDVSTNGGGIWTNVWQFQGFNPFPTPYVLDLSAEAAGQASFSLRFRFDSHSDIQGDIWQIDDVELEVFGGTPSIDPPGQATNLNPANGSSGHGMETFISWSAGSLATSHDVYFGTNPSLGAPDFQVNQTGTSFAPGTLAQSTTYYWRVDEVNDYGTAPGTTWNFTTEGPPSQSMHLTSLSGSKLTGSRGRWTAQVDISVEDQGDTPEPGVTVEGSWSNGASGGASCVTNTNGGCSVNKSNLKSNVASVTFTVDNLVKAGFNYEPGDNVGGNSVVVSDVVSDRTPIAADDSYQTDVDVEVSGNLIGNDDQGDGPASINSNSLPSNGNLNLASNGAFTYTPNPAFEGNDNFTYSIIDQDGDISNNATVSITVNSAEPPPPPGSLSVSTRTFKVKGVQHVEVSWQNFAGGTVDISRDGDPLEESPIVNDGLHEDNIGVKGGGEYLYEVCEAGSSNCASANAIF